jgi:lysophospholipid acyltransferase (LPLAT)-like uncharacterized protein
VMCGRTTSFLGGKCSESFAMTRMMRPLMAWLSKSTRRRILRMTASIGIPLYVKLIGLTWRVRFLNQENYASTNSEGLRPIFVLWHESILAGVFFHRNQNHGVMVSQHHDGDISAAVISKFGFRFSRGSTTRRGGRALFELMDRKTFPEGLVMTPDGPTGPPFSVAPGVFRLAQATGRWIVPVGFSYSRARRLKTWDSMFIPKIFSRVTISYGSPCQVTKNKVTVEMEKSLRLSLERKGLDAKQGGGKGK